MSKKKKKKYENGNFDRPVSDTTPEIRWSGEETGTLGSNCAINWTIGIDDVMHLDKIGYRHLTGTVRIVTHPTRMRLSGQSLDGTVDIPDHYGKSLGV